MKAAQSCLTLFDPMDYTWNSLGQNTGVGSLSLLQGIFPTQGLNPGLPHCMWLLYQTSHKGSPRILEWVFFSSRSSWPRNRTRVVPALQVDSLPTELSGKPKTQVETAQIRHLGDRGQISEHRDLIVGPCWSRAMLYTPTLPHTLGEVLWGLAQITCY